MGQRGEPRAARSQGGSVDLVAEPLAEGPGGPVFLSDLWPTPEEVEAIAGQAVTQEQFEQEYGRIWEGDERWRSLPTPSGPVYAWDPASTYVAEPPFFEDLSPRTIGDIEGARILVKVGDSITTDHISPAGSIKADAPAGRYLRDRGVEDGDFNSYGSRRGNHQVMMRGTFANIRLRNELADGTEGPWTAHQPTGDVGDVAGHRGPSAGGRLPVRRPEVGPATQPRSRPAKQPVQRPVTCR